MKQLFVITKNWSRHGEFSGYECIVNSFSKSIKIAKQFFLPYRCLHFFAKKTNLFNYKGVTVTKEWLLLLNIFKKKNIHVLYGDMDFYYLRYIKRFPFNLRDNKLIATFHHPPYELDKRLNYNRRKVLKTLDKIIVMGSHQIDFLKPYTDADIKFIPHGINTQYFTYDTSVIRENQLILIGVSHRDHQRNISIIKAVNKQTSTKFIVLITSAFAHLYENLDNVTVVTKNISDKELLSYYQRSKGLLLSLIDCTASNSILEALACGCPLITNNVGAVKEYIPEESGIPVFDTHAIEESVKYIIRLLGDNDYLYSISEKQRVLAKKYDWKRISEITENFIFS